MELRAKALMSGVQVESRTYSRNTGLLCKKAPARYRKMYFLYHAHVPSTGKFFGRENAGT